MVVMPVECIFVILQDCLGVNIGDGGSPRGAFHRRCSVGQRLAVASDVEPDDVEIILVWQNRSRQFFGGDSAVDGAKNCLRVGIGEAQSED